MGFSPSPLPKLPGEMPLQASSAVTVPQDEYSEIIVLLQSDLCVLDCCSLLLLLG